MEMEQCEVEVVVKRRCVILDKATLLEKGIKIRNPKHLMWTQTKQNYEKHIKWMENLKDIALEKDQAFKAWLIPLFMMGWETPMPDVMLEFFNKFLIIGANIQFGHKDKVYVINKQLIVDVFGVCAKGYVEEPKGQVNKSLVVQALYSCRFTPANSFANQWNAKSLSLPHFVKYLAIMSIIYRGRRYNIKQQKNYYVGESKEGEEGRLGTCYIQQSMQ